ncbi:MAG: nicotinate (nicotinamide) nucleotide adenylyltransferase [Bacilli bacterium]|jgi:nicotinate-nucleotide adenylyltransferase|nr:nicotinate (nicotinamide) nucleotide adenylyltransferase [Bacilli bacterium]
MKVLIYGGAFNPIHLAHIKMMEQATKELNVDKLIIVPNKEVHFKNNDNVIAFSKRKMMIEMALEKGEFNCEVVISDIEEKQANKVYTIDLIKMLKKEDSQSKFYFLIGSDHVAKLKDWYEIDNLKKEVTFIVGKRTNDFQSNEFIVINNEVLDYSSTLIRNKYQSSGLIKIDAFIRYYGLYLNEVLKQYLKPSRINHSQNVALLAQKKATLYGIDSNKAYVAGMLHDIGKYLSLDKQYRLVKDDMVFELNDQTIHAYSAVHIVKDELKINDKDILEAIKWHTTGYYEMKPLSKLIYVCDMLSADRHFDGIEQLRECLNKNLDECFKQCFLASVAYLKEKRIVISKELNDLSLKIERDEV